MDKKISILMGLSNNLKMTIILFSLLSPVVFSGCSAGNGSECAKTVSTEIQTKPIFLTDYREALKYAHSEDKPLLLFFEEKDCVFSRKMKEKVFKDSEIVELSKSFICVQIDINAAESQELCQKLNVPGSPTIQFMSSNGRPLQCVSQYQSRDELARQMEVVLYSVAWNAN